MPTPPDPAPAPRSTLDAELLLFLATFTGADFDRERAATAIRNASRPGLSATEQLILASTELFMHADPESMPLQDAVWRARRDTPVVLRSEKDGRWIVVTAADWFRVKFVYADKPDERRTLSRKELAALLGLAGPDTVVTAIVIDPEYHSKHIRTADTGDGHGHHGLTPTRRFIAFLRCEKQDISTFLVFSIFSAILYLGAPLAVDAVVSNLAFGGQSQPYVQAIVVVSIALAACLILHAMSNGFLWYISEIIQRRIFVRTAADLTHRLPRVDTGSLDEVHTPEMVNRFLDIATMQKSVAIVLLEGVNLVFSGVFGMMLLALYHPYLLVFVLLLTGAIAIILRWFGLGAEATSIRESRMKYDLVSWFEEIAHFPHLFKGPGGYAFASQRANRIVTQYVEARSSHFRILMRQIVGLFALQVIASASLLVVGGYLVINQQLTLGQLVASELIISGIVAAFAKLGKMLEAWYDALAAMDKLGHLIDLDTERAGGERPLRSTEKGAEVSAKELGFGYLGENDLFAGKNFTITAGSRVAITGPHGSGASTLMDILFGIRQPKEGYVTVDGLDLRTWSLEALRADTQLIRRNEIVDGTIVENLRLGRTDIGPDEVREALERVGLLAAVRSRPEGLDLRLKMGGSPLSSFQRTRLLLARALVQKPRLLLLDDLFDGLDDKSLARLVPAIFDKKHDWTVVVTTRDPRILALCDSIVRLAPHSEEIASDEANI